MKTFMITVFSALVMIMLSNCASTRQAKTDFDRDAKFDKYRTYSWLPDSTAYEGLASQNNNQSQKYEKQNPFLNNGLVKKRVRKVIAEHLFNLGFENATEGAPDFWVNFQLIDDEDSGFADRGGRHRGLRGHALRHRYYPRSGFLYSPWRYSYPFGYWPYHRGYGSYGYGYGWYGNYRFLDGTLIIDVIDPATSELVWRGWFSGIIKRDRTIDEKELDKAVKEILKQFPPN